MPFEKLRATVGGHARTKRNALARAGAEPYKRGTAFSSPPPVAILPQSAIRTVRFLGAHYSNSRYLFWTMTYFIRSFIARSDIARLTVNAIIEVEQSGWFPPRRVALFRKLCKSRKNYVQAVVTASVSPHTLLGRQSLQLIANGWPDRLLEMELAWGKAVGCSPNVAVVVGEGVKEYMLDLFGIRQQYHAALGLVTGEIDRIGVEAFRSFQEWIDDVDRRTGCNRPG
jgi:hypothetical protein